jgi:hypothetical protein
MVNFTNFLKFIGSSRCAPTYFLKVKFIMEMNITFIYSLKQQTFTEHLLYAKHSAEYFPYYCVIKLHSFSPNYNKKKET